MNSTACWTFPPLAAHCSIPVAHAQHLVEDGIQGTQDIRVDVEVVNPRK